MEEIFQYNTIAKESEGYFKDKGSKFIALAFHVESIEEIKKIQEQIRKKYYDARHHCYAYRINPEDIKERSSDDGEPSGTAGKPMLNQLFSFGLYDTLFIVVRYFGGTKLGVSGLINAYKTATKDAIANNNILKKNITRNLELKFEYPLMNKVMKIIKDDSLKIINQDFNLDCKILLEINKKTHTEIKNKFDNIYGVSII